MAKNPVLPLYYNDISTSTQDWTDEEFGAYMRLLIHQWRQGGLPNDYQRLTRIATSLDTNWPMLKRKFNEVDGLLKNPVMEVIREKKAKHSEKQKDNVNKRYQKSTKHTTKQHTKNLPLEEEIEIEIEIEERKKEKEKGKVKVLLPFDAAPFVSTWATWLEYRSEIGKKYKSPKSEQAALKQLSKYNAGEAIQMIEHAIASGWQSFYPLKNNNNGKQTFDPQGTLDRLNSYGK